VISAVLKDFAKDPEAVAIGPKSSVTVAKILKFFDMQGFIKLAERSGSIEGASNVTLLKPELGMMATFVGSNERLCLV
jgi:hypothetical protein